MISPLVSSRLVFLLVTTCIFIPTVSYSPNNLILIPIPIPIPSHCIKKKKYISLYSFFEELIEERNRDWADLPKLEEGEEGEVKAAVEEK
jgi:hypothetical protein